jgi:membrane protease YdiL (CAAX protease family)
LWPFILQFFLLLLLIRKDKNDGERALFKSQRWGARHIFIFVLSVNLITVVGYYIVLEGGVRKYLTKLEPFVFPLLVLLVLIVLFKYQIRQSIGSFGFKTKKKHVFLAAMIALGWHIFRCVFLYFVKGPRGLTFEVFNEVSILNFNWFYSTRLFNSVLFGAIIEEVMFRGLLYSPYRKKYGPGLAIILSGLFFASYHPSTSFLSTVAYGIFYGILYERTESIIPSMAAHSAVNLLVILTPFVVGGK